MAASALRELMAGYREVAAAERLTMATINLAQVTQQQGLLEAAGAIYRQALALAESSHDTRRVGLCLGGLATIGMERGEKAETERLIESALEAFRAIEDHVGIGNQLGNLGLLRQGQGRLEEALECFTEAARQFAQAGNVGGAIGVLQCLGELHRRQGEYGEAEEAHLRALSLAEQQKNELAQAHSMRALGQIERARGHLEKAEDFVQAGLAIHRGQGDVRGELAALIDLATVEFGLGRSQSAIGRLDDCVTRARRMSLPTPLAKALLNRALYRLDTDRMDAVRADLAEAEKLLRQLDDQVAWNVWSVTSARIAIRSAKWETAESILEAELGRAGEANLAAVRPPILGLLASIATLRGQVGRAKSLFAESESLYRALGDVEGARMALLGRARLLAESGALEQARTSMDALLVALSREEMAAPLLRAEALIASASVHELNGDFVAALGDARRAQDLFEEAGFEMSAIGAGITQVKMASRSHREAGTPLPDDLLERARSGLDAALRLEAPTMVVVARCALAEAALLSGDAEGARASARRALESAERMEFPDGVAQALEVCARAEADAELAARAVRAFNEMKSVARAARVAREWGLENDGVPTSREKA